MLLYNQRKEFIGIDEDDLNSLDFHNISELQAESHDFADLFVKKPGFIHNFKNFSWIDFILHSEADESKAIIHAKGRNYSCALHVTPFHFASDESGYSIIIKNLRALKGAEDAQATKDIDSAGGIQSSPAPQSKSDTLKTVHASALAGDSMPELDISLDDIRKPEPEISGAESSSFAAEPEPELPSFEESLSQELSEPEALDIPEPEEIDPTLSTPSENEFGAPIDIDYNAPLTLDEDVTKDESEETHEEEPAAFDLPEETPPQKIEAPMLGDYVSTEGSEHLSDLITAGTYQYDPNIAANELGLPVDLIEEFIGDFIDQAHEFHDDLYASVNAGDFDNVQILSHKLKGVAANLRVEDAFDTLSVVNVSKNADEVLPNLNHFYKVIAKLEGKDIPEPAADLPASSEATPPIEAEATAEEDEDLYNIGIKQPDEGPMLIDEEVALAPEDDDLYDDLLSKTEDLAKPEPEPEIPVPPSAEEDIYDDLISSPAHLKAESAETETAELPPSSEEDIYDDLLAEPTTLEPDFTQTEASEAPSSIEEDIYDDMLGAPQNDTPAPAEVQVAQLNFDPQRSANELGIPIDVMNEFVRDFKEQIALHQNNFQNALDDQDIQGINKTATLLKGMSDNLRLNEISEVLKGLQIEKDINNTAEALASLQAYADQL